MTPVSINSVGQWTTFTTFHFKPSGWLGNCMSKINILFVITFFSRKIETWDQCSSIEGDSVNISHNLQFYTYRLIRELHVQNYPVSQEDRDIRPVSIHRVGQCTPFTTFHFTPSGWLGNYMSKIILLFVITFVSRKIETWDLCPSMEWDSVHISQPSVLPLLVAKWITRPKWSFFLYINTYI